MVDIIVTVVFLGCMVALIVVALRMPTVDDLPQTNGHR